MSKWQLWITANNGDDVPQELRVWNDEEEILELRLSAYANNAVITVEPLDEVSYEK